eukprot:UN21303
MKLGFLVLLLLPLIYSQSDHCPLNLAIAGSEKGSKFSGCGTDEFPSSNKCGDHCCCEENHKYNEVTGRCEQCGYAVSWKSTQTEKEINELSQGKLEP